MHSHTQANGAGGTLCKKESGEGRGEEKGEEKRSRCSSGPQTPPPLFFNMSLVIVASYLKNPVWGCGGMTSLNHEGFNRLSVQVCVRLSIPVAYTHTHTH